MNLAFHDTDSLKSVVVKIITMARFTVYLSHLYVIFICEKECLMCYVQVKEHILAKKKLFGFIKMCA